jgi:hypothetical protein
MVTYGEAEVRWMDCPTGTNRSPVIHLWRVHIGTRLQDYTETFNAESYDNLAIYYTI